MLPHALRPVLPLLLLPLAVALTGCGKTALAGAPAPAAMTAARALSQVEKSHPIEGPLTARAVLAHGHAVAKLLDAKAAFTGLTGTRIGADGVPAKGGSWILSYIGTEPVPGSTGKNPYGTGTYRRITVTVPASGKPKAEAVEAEGLPLGLCYYDAPMPAFDSNHAVARLQSLRPEEPAAPTGYRLVLTGLMSQGHFQELVWKISRVATQSTGGAGDRAVTLSATTGEPILK